MESKIDRRRWALAAASSLLLPGCATPPPATDGWHAVAIPGKRATHYEWVRKDGRAALMARAERSASLWRRRVRVEPPQIGTLSFSWRVDALLPGAHVADAEREDAVARVVLGFAGEHGRLSMRNRMLFDLAEALSGEPPPFATLMYVWDTHAPLDSVVVNPRTDRIRKIVVDSGHRHLGGWRAHRREVAADFRRAFGEEPGPLISLAVMTDADNTGSAATAWYGPIALQ